MMRAELLVLDRDLASLSERIGSMAVLHPVDVGALGPWAASLTWHEMQGLTARYASVGRRIDRLAELLRLPAGLPAENVRLSPEETLREVDGLLERIEPEARDLEDRARRQESERLRLEGLEAQLALLSPLGVDLAELRALHFLHMVSGLIPPERLERLMDALEETPHLLVPVRRVGDRELILAFVQRRDADLLNRALQSAYLERLEIPAELVGTPAEAMVQLQTLRQELGSEAAELERDRRTVAERWAGDLQRARGELEVNGRVVALWSRTGRTERTRLLVGWVPRGRVGSFSEEVAAGTHGRSLLVIADPDAGVDGDNLVAPTALSNPSVLRPFEALTSTYGLPDYWDLDPTPVAAFLFVLLFGAMFGDLGQGFVLLAVGTLLAVGRLMEGQRDFGRIMAACGFSAMVFGVLYGSVFAAEGVIPAFWVRPIESPSTVLVAAVLLGAAVVSVGLLLGIATAWRRRDRAEFFLGQNGLVGLWLYWGLLGTALIVVFAPGNLSPWLVAALVGLPLLLRFLHGPIARAARWRPGGEDGAYVVQAGVESFDLVVRFVSNTASFLRVGAFALGHVGLGVTVFALYALLRGYPAASILLLIFGNLLILTLETLIVGIQALRLEYYEFFTKFMHGGGVAYRPFELRRAEVGPAPADGGR
jgi:V/A-type H+-transporting ATPase subunit I